MHLCIVETNVSMERIDRFVYEEEMCMYNRVGIFKREVCRFCMLGESCMHVL